jgi:hypothetical protein
MKRWKKRFHHSDHSQRNDVNSVRRLLLHYMVSDLLTPVSYASTSILIMYSRPLLFVVYYGSTLPTQALVYSRKFAYAQVILGLLNPAIFLQKLGDIPDPGSLVHFNWLGYMCGVLVCKSIHK